MASSARPLIRPRAVRSARTLLRASGPYVVLAAGLAFLAWCTATDISRPGLQYDETLFVNAALGGHYVNGSFVSSRFHGVVTMVMPYSGALKSWLYAAVFDVFGSSVSSIRIPMLVVLAATVGVAFVFARRLFGAWLAALLALLMATDPTYMTMTKADWGPVALSGFLRVGALAAYFGWLRTESVRYLWLLAGALALGAFNKIDFVAFAAALALAAAVVHRREIAARLRRRPLACALPLAALAVAMLVEYAKIYRPARDFPAPRSHADLIGRVSEMWSLFRRTMDGTGVYQYMTTLPLGHRTAIAAFTVVAVALAAGLVGWQLSRRGRRPGPSAAPLAEAATATGFFLLLLLAVAAALVATPEAIGPHHAMLLWPLPALLAVSLVSAATRLRRGWIGAGLVGLLALGLVWQAGTQVRVAEAYRSGFADDRAWSPIWTLEVYPLVRAVRRAAPRADSIVTADWGVGNQLLALGDDVLRRRLVDAWGTFAGGSADAVDQLAAARLRGRRVVLVLHTAAGELMPGTHAAALAMVRRLAPAHGAREIYRGRALVADVVDDGPVALGPQRPAWRFGPPTRSIGSPPDGDRPPDP